MFISMVYGHVCEKGSKVDGLCSSETRRTNPVGVVFCFIELGQYLNAPPNGWQDGNNANNVH